MRTDICLQKLSADDTRRLIRMEGVVLNSLRLNLIFVHRNSFHEAV